MPIHFAAARTVARSPIARALEKRPVGAAANDNGGQTSAFAFDDGLRAALLHFADHGVRAADEARRMAERAHSRGDMAECRRWIGVCKALDRPMARRLERALAGDAALIG